MTGSFNTGCCSTCVLQIDDGVDGGNPMCVRERGECWYADKESAWCTFV